MTQIESSGGCDLAFRPQSSEARQLGWQIPLLVMDVALLTRGLVQA